jgi:hypothetical protein
MSYFDTDMFDRVDIIRELADLKGTTLTMALKGSGGPAMIAFIKARRNRAASLLLEDMDYLEDPKPEDIAAAQKYILMVFARLNEQGEMYYPSQAPCSPEQAETEAAFLFLKKWAVIYKDQRETFSASAYGVPRKDLNPEDCPMGYKGIGCCYTPATLANTKKNRSLLEALEAKNAVKDMLVFAENDALNLLNAAGKESRDFELAYFRLHNSNAPVPKGYESAGFEPAYMGSFLWSVNSECFFLPLNQGTDREGIAFAPWFKQLNRHGLFDSPEVAAGFMADYLEKPWADYWDFHITEVFARNTG